MIGHPKTATFRLFDLVGIDVLGLVAKNLYQNAPDDEQREVFKLPKVLEGVLERKWFGNKSGQGFYKKSSDGILTLDYNTMEYRAQKKAVFPSLEMVKPMENALERIASLVRNKDRAGAFLWKLFSAMLSYAANRIPEISDDILNVDNAMKWGFGWSHGLFEAWDAIGVRKSVERMRMEGKTPPAVDGPVSRAARSDVLSHGKRRASVLGHLHRRVPAGAAPAGNADPGSLEAGPRCDQKESRREPDRPGRRSGVPRISFENECYRRRHHHDGEVGAGNRRKRFPGTGESETRARTFRWAPTSCCSFWKRRKATGTNSTASSRRFRT